MSVVSPVENCYKRLATSGVALMGNDRTYFMRRAAQERSAASHARGKARQAHLALAETYEARVHEANGAQPADAAA